MYYISKQAAVVGTIVAAAGLVGTVGITAAVASTPDPPARPAPAVTVTVTAEPLPAVTVTADPLPAVTVTVTADPLPAVTVTKTVTRTVTAEPKRTTAPRSAGNFADGTWKVPSEIPAGTYVTDVADGEHCYYARLSGFGGELDELIANQNYEGPARGRFTVAASDAGVHFSGGCTWSRG